METNEIQFDRIPIFKGIAHSEAESLMDCLKARVGSYQKGDYITLDQGDEALVGIVLSGIVHMVKEDVWGHQGLITYMREGELFGEMTALHAEDTHYVSFVAAQPATVLFLSMKYLLHPCREQCPCHLTLAQNMFHLMGEKNVRLMERFEIISRKTLREKILTYLSIQSQRQGSKYITIPINRTEMANYLQSNRSAMTRELADMKAGGLIDFDGNTFILK